MDTKTKALVLTIAFIALIAASFFATTWLAMILAGIVGHFANNDWLKHLSFWQCSPVWIVVIILRTIFK